MQCLKTLFMFGIILLLLPDPAPADIKSDTVQNWAKTLGDELWDLHTRLTKWNETKKKYQKMNASVKKKDGAIILQSALQSVSTMLNRKINAVKCIHATAEKLAKEFNYSYASENFTFCSAKYSTFFFEDGTNRTEEPIDTKKDTNKTSDFTEIYTEKDSHFYNISVNTDQSCVHVPTNIYYKERDARNAVLWSEGLDEIFIRNYNSDPSLVWQYFGSSYGPLRFFPAMPWRSKQIKVDDYDCRVRSWYIEAATCSKDVIILFDVSGSMTGFKNYVARRTLKALLDTLSNNDYVNVYTFKNETKEVVHCFVDLVQATKENLASIHLTLEPTGEDKKDHKVPLEGYANLTIAFTKAFTTLKTKRSNCNVTSTQGCNQLVMLITDYVPSNLSTVFDEYNREVVDDKVYTPVRVFTYLIGKEVTNVQEIQQIACSNRGYFAHIHSVEEVQQQVLKYINVIARPMILDGGDPPPTWTHANIDETRTNEWKVSSDYSKPDEDKLVTSVAIPAFDYQYNKQHKDDAILLGVAGTDVPIDSIAKLAQPHQLGVNGYSFIVSNNGYLLLHPLLVTSINGKLQENYNSVDFVEVEQVDDGKGARELGEKIINLRGLLVNATHGNMSGVEILYHYDSMRRIARVKHDYFFSALKGTPFSMGISLPQGYGDTELQLRDNPLEAKEGMELTGINVTDYFRFNYRVHPDWVYCKFHYLEGHETNNAEEETWNFLVDISNNKIDITKKQYIEESTSDTFSVEKNCGNATTQLGKNDYYCNDDLIKQLVFDAKLSTPIFEKWQADAKATKLAKLYNVSVRFIATGSGLTRWHYIFDDYKNEKVDDHGKRENNYTGKVFGDDFYNAIEETWYKAAVLQHMIDVESLVIATPLPTLDSTMNTAEANKVCDKDSEIDDDITFTASYAIFYKDNDSETPASVVGFQFSYKSFIKRFLEITSGNMNFSCDHKDFECYVIDSSGYIVLSKEQHQVGRFFGVDNPYVLQDLINKSAFDYVEVFNYQAVCDTSVGTTSKSWYLSTPFNVAGGLIKWLITELIVLLSNWNNFAFSAAIGIEDDYSELFYKLNTAEDTTTKTPDAANKTIKTKCHSEEKKEEELYSCDHQIYLYILNQTYFKNVTNLKENKAGTCNPAYWAAPISKTNLLLTVVKKPDTMFSESCPKPNDTRPKNTVNSTTSKEPCHKLELGRLPRRRLEGCFTYHDKERNITACGKGSFMKIEMMLLASAIVISKLVKSLQF